MTLAMTAVACFAGVLGGLVVWRAPAGRGGLIPLVAGFAAVGVCGGLGLGVLWGRLDHFGVLHLAYLGLVISVPLLGVGLAARVVTSRPRITRGWLVAVAPLLLPAMVGVYATHIEPFRLVTDEVTVPLDSACSGDDPVRLGVLADLQTNDVGAHEHRAVDRLLAADPDVILVPGDLFQGSSSDFAGRESEMRSLLARLEAPYGVYFVRGDVDTGGYTERLLSDSTAVILDNEIVELQIGDRQIELAGVTLDFTSAAAVATSQTLESQDPADASDGIIRILMAHRPDAVLDLQPDSPVDLVVAGHTHGGQVVIPGFGPPITLSGVPRSVAAGGLHEVNGNQIYVSTGVGLERGQAPQLRLFSRPSVGILTLDEQRSST